MSGSLPGDGECGSHERPGAMTAKSTGLIVSSAGEAPRLVSNASCRIVDAAIVKNSDTEVGSPSVATLTHMPHEQVGVRALQQNASGVVKRAAAGEIIDITDRGRLVARIVPASGAGMEALRSAGLVRVAQRSATELPPPLPIAPQQPTLGQILNEQREYER